VRRGYRLLVAIAALALLMLLLASAPARLVSAVVPRQQLLLSGISGTVWRGSAARAVLPTALGNVHLGSLTWRLEPLSLLRLSPRLRLRSEWGQQRLALRARRAGDALRLSRVDATLDARLLQQVLPVDLRGRLAMQLDALEVTQAQVRRAEGRVVWERAAWASVSGLHALGTYAAQLSTPASGTVEAQLQTLAGPIDVTGTARLTAERYAIDARLGSAAPLHPELSRALALVATPGENGYLLRLDGPLAAPP
jgi:general secretion pathway protein N